jgi:hypothetical protein
VVAVKCTHSDGNGRVVPILIRTHYFSYQLVIKIEPFRLNSYVNLCRLFGVPVSLQCRVRGICHPLQHPAEIGS